MKRIAITHWPLLVATVASSGYIILFDKLPLLQMGFVTSIVCLGLVALAICNLVLFSIPHRITRFKRFTIVNARLLNIAGIMGIMMLNIHLESTNPFNKFSSDRETKLLLVCASAIFCYCSLIRIRFIKPEIKYS